MHPGDSACPFLQDLQAPCVIGVKMSNQNVLDVLWSPPQLPYRRQDPAFAAWNSRVYQSQSGVTLEQECIDITKGDLTESGNDGLQRSGDPIDWAIYRKTWVLAFRGMPLPLRHGLPSGLQFLAARLHIRGSQ